MHTFITIGSLVYIDCFSGLIPAKLIGHRRVETITGHRDLYTVKVTGRRAAYRYGEIVADLEKSSVVPRANVRNNKVIGTWEFVGN